MVGDVDIPQSKGFMNSVTQIDFPGDSEKIPVLPRIWKTWSSQQLLNEYARMDPNSNIVNRGLLTNVSESAVIK